MEMIDSFFPFAATTGSITVRVAVSYLPEQSHPALGRWFWAYHVRVENHGEDARIDMGVVEGMLRINIGLEDPRDIIADLDQALTKVGL